MDFLLTVVFLVAAGSLLALLYGFGPLAVQWVRTRQSAKWPWVPGMIGEGAITIMTSGRYGTSYELTVSYSYRVKGQEYTGTYRETGATHEAAEGSLRSLRGLPPPVRYKPGHPEISVMDPYRDAGLAYECRGRAGENT